MSESPWQPDFSILAEGEYNRRIFQEELGLSEQELAVLKREGVI